MQPDSGELDACALSVKYERGVVDEEIQYNGVVHTGEALHG